MPSPEPADQEPNALPVDAAVEIALASLEEALRQLARASANLFDGERRFDAASGILGEQVHQVETIRTELDAQRVRHDATIAALAEHRRQAEVASACLLRSTEALDAAARDLQARQHELDGARHTVAARDEQLAQATESLSGYRRGFDTVRTLVQDLLAVLAGRDAAIDALSADVARQALALDQLAVERDELERWSHELHQEVARLKARRR